MEDLKLKLVPIVVIIAAMVLSFGGTVAGQGKIAGHLGVSLGVKMAELRAVLKKTLVSRRQGPVNLGLNGFHLRPTTGYLVGTDPGSIPRSRSGSILKTA